MVEIALVGLGFVVHVRPPCAATRHRNVIGQAGMGYAVIGRLEAIVLRQALYKRGVCIRRVEQVRIRGVLHHYHENVVQMGERGRLRPTLTELRDGSCLVRDGPAAPAGTLRLMPAPTRADAPARTRALDR